MIVAAEVIHILRTSVISLNDSIATHILAFEGDSETAWFEGNHAAYIEDLQRRKGADAEQPHRIKFKPLVRK